MRLSHTAVALAVGALMSGTALGQGTATAVQRDVDQQQRIEQGLQSGQLTTREAAKLEKQETKVEAVEKNALKDGTLTPAEKARIAKTQNAVSADIAAQKHDAQVGNPNSASSAHVTAKEARAGANGRVGAGEQVNVQTAENRQSAHIHAKKHNTVVAP